jgi:hypothetical protein
MPSASTEAVAKISFFIAVTPLKKKEGAELQAPLANYTGLAPVPPANGVYVRSHH